MIEVNEYVRTNKGVIGELISETLSYPEPSEWILKGNNNKIVIVECNDYPVKHSKQLIDLIEVGDIVNGMEVLDLMLLLQKLEIPIFICSTREPIQIINWWNKQGFWCEAISISNDKTFWNDLKYIGVTNRKLPAQLYIDDRAYKYTGQTVKQFILDNSEED